MKHNPHSASVIRKGAMAAAALISLATVLEAGTLSESSPFIPPQAAAPVGPTPPVNPQAQNLAFRGVYAIGEKRFYNIFNKQLNKGVWVADGDASAEYKVVSFTESSNTVRLKVDGTEQDYPLDRPAWISVPVQGAPPPFVAGMPQQPGQPGGPGGPNRPPPPRRRVISPNTPPPAPPGTQAYNAWANMPANQRPPTPPPSSPPPMGPPSGGVPQLPANLVPPNFTPPTNFTPPANFTGGQPNTAPNP
ncbi:MAG: hypothetical protein SFY80_11570 [Verrucomicrobiota bacterium]|nr:hypothetical protein [Verrucomicrobiota bacterium]